MLLCFIFMMGKVLKSLQTVNGTLQNYLVHLSMQRVVSCRLFRAKGMWVLQISGLVIQDHSIL